jgi:PPOX class probable F420-dependent enzyme
MSRRDQIRMTQEEIRAFLAEHKVINVATMGPNGRPHLTPLWYYPHEDGMATWTYRKSQKAANLRRLPEATVLIESGESYEKLCGVSMECDVALVDDADAVAEIGTRLLARYSDGGGRGGPAAPPEFVAAQAAKRVGLVLTPTRTVSWDHAKLGGAY